MKCSYASMNQQFALAVPECIYGDIQNTMGLYNILTNILSNEILNSGWF